MRSVTLVCLALAGCATMNSEEYVASLGAYDVCRLTMGGPHARAAEAEASRRGLNCQAMYSTIQAEEANRRAAVLQYLQTPPSYQPAPLTFTPIQAPPAPVVCTSRQVLNTVQTVCN